MNPKEIERLIKDGLPLPESANLEERFYFNAIDVIFSLYKLKRLDRARFKNLQRQYSNLFDQMQLWKRIYQTHIKIRKELVQVNFKDCEICRKVQALLDGEMKGGDKNAGG